LLLVDFIPHHHFNVLHLLAVGAVMFAAWYADVDLIGCSSHYGRRTFITNAARKISSVGGSLRDVQALAGHSSLAVTQRYIEGDGDARAKVVEFV
jgi:integrase